MNLQILACFKHQNGKKLSSHLWFFEGFCRLLNPEFCTLMDIGTQPYETGLLNFIEALESNPKIGGVSGFMTLDI
jgi:chitin synthase